MILLTCALLGGPPVEASLLDGRRERGELVDLSASRVTLQAGGRRIETRRDEVLRLDFKPAVPAKAPIVVRLVDGSRFGARTFESDGRTAKVAGPFGTLSIAVERIAAVLLTDDPQDAADFSARAADPLKMDRITIARDGKKLNLDGIIGRVGGDKIEFTLDGDVLPINRSRSRALYFAGKGTASKPAALIADRRGDVWAAAEWRWQNGAALRSPSGFERAVPVDEVASIDLSAGRVAYLSDLEPSLMQHVPGFDHPWLVQRDRGPRGGELQLDGRAFAKGLVIHSRTTLEYDLGGAYRRFQAVAGVPPSAGPAGDADVRVSADGKLLWRKRVRAGDEPESLNLPMDRVKVLRLDVDFGGNLDLGDHVAFADAKVLK